MSILRLAIFAMASVVIAGTLVLIALLIPAFNNAMGLSGAAVIGFVIAIVATNVVVKKIVGNTA